MSAFIDLKGQRFTRLVVQHRAPNIRRRTAWVCLCDCGNRHTVQADLLRGNQTRSCGCLSDESRRTTPLIHGHTRRDYKSPEYATWNAIRQRCSNPRVKGYERYGGRGIKVCDRWSDSFPNFLADLGPRPGAGYSIERVDNDGDYTPLNCVWLLFTEQAKNRRSGIPELVRSQIKPLRAQGFQIQQIADTLGISISTVKTTLRPKIRVRRKQPTSTTNTPQEQFA